MKKYIIAELPENLDKNDVYVKIDGDKIIEHKIIKLNKQYVDNSHINKE